MTSLEYLKDQNPQSMAKSSKLETGFMMRTVKQRRHMGFLLTDLWGNISSEITGSQWLENYATIQQNFIKNLFFIENILSNKVISLPPLPSSSSNSSLVLWYNAVINRL